MKNWQNNCPKCNKPVIINEVGLGPRKIECPHCSSLFRFNTDTGEVLNDAYVEGDSIILICRKCNAKNRVPAHRGNLHITCSKCGDKFYLLGDPNYKCSASNNTPEQPIKKKTVHMGYAKCPGCGKNLDFECEHDIMTVTCTSCNNTFGYDSKIDEIMPHHVSPCPYCGDILLIEPNNGDRIMECDVCKKEYAYDSDKGCLIENVKISYCPHCNIAHLINNDIEGDLIMECDNCGNTYVYDCDNNKIQNDYWISTCPHCHEKGLIDKNDGVFEVSCHVCNQNYFFDSDSGVIVDTPDDVDDDYEEIDDSVDDNSSDNVGFFGKIKNYMDKRKEQGEFEENLVYNSSMTRYIGDICKKALLDNRELFRDALVEKDYIKINVTKTSFMVVYYKHHYERDYYQPQYQNLKTTTKYLTNWINFKTIQNICRTGIYGSADDTFSELTTGKGKKALQDVVLNEYMTRAGFVICRHRMLYILKSQV